MMPPCHILLKVPHEHKNVIEVLLGVLGVKSPSRPSTPAGWSDGETSKVDPGWHRGPQDWAAIGYSISREDAGRWVADNLVLRLDVR